MTLDPTEKKQRIAKALQSRHLLYRHLIDVKVQFLRQFFPDSEIETILMTEDVSTATWNKFVKRLSTVVSRDVKLVEARQAMEKKYRVTKEFHPDEVRQLFLRSEHPILKKAERQPRALGELFFTLRRTSAEGGENIIKVLSHRPFSYAMKAGF